MRRAARWEGLANSRASTPTDSHPFYGKDVVEGLFGLPFHAQARIQALFRAPAMHEPTPGEAAGGSFRGGQVSARAERLSTCKS